MKDPMPILRELFLTPDLVTVGEPIRTTGKPGAVIKKVRGQYQVTFKLKKLIAGQVFLGLYPAAATLPDVSRLNTGDYALLNSGEILQII